MTGSRVIAVVALWGTLVGSPSVGVETRPTSAEVRPALEPDPEVTRIIAALGENASALLPPIKTVGDWNETTRLYGMRRTGPVGTTRGGPLDPWHTCWQVTCVPEMRALIWANPLSVHEKIPHILGSEAAVWVCRHGTAGRAAGEDAP